MATDTKDIIYLDIDEDITGIIHKLQKSPKSIVALVLPKRATALQSIVNMKLLRRTAEQNGKKVVLITSEAALMPLAGAASVHVASNLSSKPFLPPSPEVKLAEDDIAELPIRQAQQESATQHIKPEEVIQVDNTARQPSTSATSQNGKDKESKNKKKLKVPNFESFRKKLIIGVIVALLLIGGLIWALFFSAKATVTLKTEASDISVDLDFTADTSASSVDAMRMVIPASKRESNQNASEKVPATGSKDKGTKAGGTISLKNCGSNSATIPAGTGVSSGTFTFITQQSISLSDGNFDGSGNCKNSGSHTGTVNVVAQNNGDQYNLSARTYTVSGFSQITANGSQMSGGSSNVVKVVSDQDVESAKQKITSKKDEKKQELSDQLKKDGYIPIAETFSDNTPTFNVSPSVDSEATDVTVSATITYSMIGIKESDLNQLVDAKVKDQIDPSKQGILGRGLSNALFKIGDDKNGKTKVSLSTVVSVGPDINQDELKNEISGKKTGEAEKILSARPGIIDAKVVVTPSWNTKLPKPSKIKLVIENADGKKLDTQKP